MRIILIVCCLLGFLRDGAFAQLGAACECREGSLWIVGHVDTYKDQEDEGVMREALTIIQDENLRVRIQCVFDGYICPRDEDVLSSMITLASHESFIVRAESLNTLKHFGSCRTKSVARSALNDPVARVRLMALAAVVASCDHEIRAEIKKMKRVDPDEDVRRYAKRVAGELRGDGKNCRPILTQRTAAFLH